MKPISIYLPQQLIDLLDTLVSRGLYLNRGEAIRLILTRALAEELKALQDAGILSHAKPPSTIRLESETSERKHFHAAFRLPHTLVLLMDVTVQRLGLKSRSELVRLALVDFINRYLLRRSEG